MFIKKRKMFILASLAGLYFIGLHLSVRINSGDPAKFSGDESLKRAVWTLAAFMPPIEGRTPQNRLIRLEADEANPAIEVRMRFKSPRAVWPGWLTIVINPDDPKSGDYLRIEDSVPFGRDNLTMTMAGGRPYISKPPPIKSLVKTLGGLNSRLQSRPRLETVDWREQAPGFQTAAPEILYGARVGENKLHLVKMDPEKFDFKPYYEKEITDAPPMDIARWSQRLPLAAAIINGGQFRNDRSYMGLLVRDGQALSSKEHPYWKAFFVASPRKSKSAVKKPPAVIIDRGDAKLGLKPEDYRNAAQSFMLLDRHGRLRARDSYNLASRAAVGEDADGQILFIMTPCAMSLYDFGRVLQSPQLKLIRAMTLDGGFEAQLAWRGGANNFISKNQLSIHPKWGPRLSFPGYIHSLPVVLAAIPKTSPPALSD